MGWSWECVVEVLRRDNDKYVCLGSGALVNKGRVLTARHVVVTQDGSAKPSLAVRLEGQSELVDAKVHWSAPKDLDIAVLETKLEHPAAPAPLSVLSGEPWPGVRTWETKGFPVVRVEKPATTAKKYFGQVGSWSAHEKLLALGAQVSPEDWRGLSGAAVIMGERIVGVVRSVEAGHDNELLNATPVGTFLDMAEFRQAMDIGQEDELLEQRVQRIIRDIAKWLATQDELVSRLATQFEISYAPGEGPFALASDIVRNRKAVYVAQKLNHLDAELVESHGSSAVRVALRTLLWQILPMATDWKELVRRGLTTFSSRQQAIDLPLRSETLAEIVLAGIDDRCCQFAPAKSNELPIGATVVRIPTLAKSALLDRDGSRLAQLIVKEFATAVDLPTHDISYDDLRTDVDAVLHYHAHDAPPKERLPYYLLFAADELQGKDKEHDLWTLARGSIGSALPTLRLVRLTGSANRDHTLLAKHIDSILRRK